MKQQAAILAGQLKGNVLNLGGKPDDLLAEGKVTPAEIIRRVVEATL